MLWEKEPFPQSLIAQSVMEVLISTAEKQFLLTQAEDVTFVLLFNMSDAGWYFFRNLILW